MISKANGNRSLHTLQWAVQPHPGLVVGLAFFLFFGICLNNKCTADTNLPPFRMGFSSAMFAEVNENDAKAAVKVWGQTVASERGIPVSPASMIYNGVPAVREALKKKEIDAVALTSVEFAALKPEIDLAPLFLNFSSGTPTDQYVLLVHQEAGISSLRELRGRSLVLHENLRECLAQTWLETELAQGGLHPDGFLGKLSTSSKLSKVVLPVFFRQADACVVTLKGFETLTELNPQLGKQLKVLTTSPELVTALFCFRQDYAPSFKGELLSSIGELHRTPSGQQILMVFESETIQEMPPSFLEKTLQFLVLHEQLCGSAKLSAAQPAQKKTKEEVKTK